MRNIRLFCLQAAVLLGFAVFGAGLAPTMAQTGKPASVTESQLLDALKPGSVQTSTINGRVSIPDGKSAVLIQPAGRDWRAARRETLPLIGGIVILGMLAAVVLFYVVRGRIAIDGGPAGRTMLRFASFDRFTHWLTATSFILLALSGLNITFGRSLLLPVIGPDLFSALSQLGKFIHNYISFAFALGVFLMFVLWLKDNIPSPRDVSWLAQGGGLIGNAHPPAGRFNAGQKAIFWVVVLGGTALAVTGYMLMFPFTVADIAGMQLANVLHGLIAVVVIAVMIAHIYIGSVGMEGAIEAMRDGQVDVNWAKQHHALWVEKETMANNGKAMTPAE